MKTLAKPLLLPLLVITSLVLLAVVASRYTTLDWLVRNDRWLRDAIQAYPVRSALVAFFVYLLTSLIPGLAGKSIVLGWLFGLVVGVLIVNTALVAAALVTFLLCRYYLKSAVQARLGFYLRPMQERMSRDGAIYLLTLRLAHMPFSFMNYASGAGTDISLCRFWWTTQLGILPGNIVFVYAGTRLPTLQKLVAAGPLSLLDAPMILALCGTAFLPWSIRRILRFRRRHNHEAGHSRAR